jgi:hypothetical protein
MSGCELDRLDHQEDHRDKQIGPEREHTDFAGQGPC